MRLFVFLAAFAFGLGAALPALAQSDIFANDVLMCSGRPWIDVRCNGALGDGSHDDTAAINTTIAAAITGNFPAHFPAGTYKVTSKLTWDYQGIAGNGLEIISRGAVIDGRSIAAGNVLQIQCSGGTTGSPAACNHFVIENDFYVQGNTPAYAVVIGKTDFSDVHNAAKIDHLVVTNASAAAGAGGIQANFLTNSELWLSGKTAGGSSSIAGVALEQVQTSGIGGYGSTAGDSGVALLVENGASVGNSFVGFAYDPTTNTCVSVTSASARLNTWIAPYFPCTTATGGGTSANQNSVIGPTFAGTNMGPLSSGFSVIGRGSLSRYSAPAVASRTMVGADDGTILSPANATGPSTQFTARSLPVTLPDPAVVGPGWTAAFVSDQSKAIVLTTSGASRILVRDKQFSTMTISAAGQTSNFEEAMVSSDGANFRLLHISRRAALLNGIDNSLPSNWYYPGGPGYQVTVGDNAGVLSSALTSTGLALTLPQTPTLTHGWSMMAAADAGKPITIAANGTAGGTIITGPTSIASISVPSGGFAVLQFDGSNFRVLSYANQQMNGVSPFQLGAACDGVTDDAVALQAWLNLGAGGIHLTLPAATCLFNTALSLPGPGHLSIRGLGPEVSTLRYGGGNGNIDLISIGTVGVDSTGVTLAELKIASNTTMTGGAALHVKQLKRSALRNVYADSQDGNGKLWWGVWFDHTDSMTYDGFYLAAQQEGLRQSDSDTVRLQNGRITPATAHTQRTGVHIGGGSGGFECGNGVDIANNGTNVLIDNAISLAGNRQLFFFPGCIIDTGAIDDNVLINSATSTNGSIDFYNWNSAAVRHAVNIQSWPNGYVTFSGGQTWNAGSSCIYVQDASAIIAISPSVQIHSCGGYGVDASVPTPNITPGSEPFFNTPGSFGPNTKLGLIDPHNGFRKLPTSQTCEWGTVSLTGGANVPISQTVTLPQAFPNVVLRSLTSAMADGFVNGGQMTVTAQQIGLSQLNVQLISTVPVVIPQPVVYQVCGY